MYLFNVFILCNLSFILCGDFYIGMFQKNDFLMAQDIFYKERNPFGIITANYGRLFSCPITYIKVSDRLGIGNGPIVQIIRGGIRKKYVVLRLTSQFTYPISVNIYIGCENKMKFTTYHFDTTAKVTTARVTTSKVTTENVTTENVTPNNVTNKESDVTGANTDNDSNKIAETTLPID